MISSQSIQQQLMADCQAFVDVADNLSEEQFSQQPDGKWSVAGVMQHLYLSARPVARLLTGPREVLLQWGKPDVPSRDYDTLASLYEQVLTTGVKAPAMFTPRPDDMQAAKMTIVERFTGTYQAMVEAIGNWTDEELNGYVLPHPALGRLSVREMLDFVSIHTQHHWQLLAETRG